MPSSLLTTTGHISPHTLDESSCQHATRLVHAKVINIAAALAGLPITNLFCSLPLEPLKAWKQWARDQDDSPSPGQIPA